MISIEGNYTKMALMTFAEHMEHVLYGPQGYYSSGKARSGRRGDYFNAPDVGPGFGKLLARIFHGWQKTLNSSRFHIGEVGAGEGVLARDLRRALTGPFPYTTIERSRARQKKLQSAGFRVLSDIAELAAAPVRGC